MSYPKPNFSITFAAINRRCNVVERPMITGEKLSCFHVGQLNLLFDNNRPTIAKIKAACDAALLTEHVYREKMFVEGQKARHIEVRVPKRFLNNYTFLRLDKNTLRWELDRRKVLAFWFYDGCPLKWGLGV